VELLFAKRLRELRIAKGLTQQQLGDIFNVGQTSISDWESRGNQPNYQILIELVAFFEVTAGQLLGTEEY